MSMTEKSCLEAACGPLVTRARSSTLIGLIHINEAQGTAASTCTPGTPLLVGGPASGAIPTFAGRQQFSDWLFAYHRRSIKRLTGRTTSSLAAWSASFLGQFENHSGALTGNSTWTIPRGHDFTALAEDLLTHHTAFCIWFHNLTASSISPQTPFGKTGHAWISKEAETAAPIIPGPIIVPHPVLGLMVPAKPVATMATMKTPIARLGKVHASLIEKSSHVHFSNWTTS